MHMDIGWGGTSTTKGKGSDGIEGHKSVRAASKRTYTCPYRHFSLLSVLWHRFGCGAKRNLFGAKMNLFGVKRIPRGAKQKETGVSTERVIQTNVLAAC